MGSLSSEVDSENEEMDWQQQLQCHRLLIARRVDYTKLSPALQSALIFDHEDHEMIRNPFQNPTTITRANAMIDKLLRKGKDHYEKFLKILGGYYPDVFTEITGFEAPPAVPAVQYGVQRDDGSGEVLSFIFAKLSEKKQECVSLVQQNESYRNQIKENLTEIERLKEAVKDYETRNERYERIESDLNSMKQVSEHMKTENYKICMRLVDMNEENSKLREQNMLLRLDNDKSIVELRKLQNKVHSERSQSVRLRNQLDTGPSEQDITTMQKEIDHLKLKIAQLHNKKNHYKDDVDTRIQILQRDLEEAIEMYEESSENLNKLREELNKVEADRDKYFEENERLQLQCSALTDDCEMYKTRRDAVWQQLQEVEKERDQLMKERNEAQLTAQTYMDEKTKYWYKIRQLEEVQDKLSLELREKDKVIKELSAKTALNLDMIPDDECMLTLPEDELSESHETQRMSPRFSPRRSPLRVRSDSLSVRRKNSRHFSTRSASGRVRSLTNVIRDDIFHNLVEKDGNVYEISINGNNLQSMVEFIGGNETGIFFEKIAQRSYAEIIGLVPGMKLLKVSTNEVDAQELHLRNCTLENAINIIQEIGDSLRISVQYKEDEFLQLQEQTKEGKDSGDSFYVRANFSLKKEGYLGFEKGAILHVTNTRPDKTKKSMWLATIVDSTTGADENKTGYIPSYRNCISNSQLLRSYSSSNRPLSIVDFTRLFLTMPGSQDFSATQTEERGGEQKSIPYTLVKPASTEKEPHRPCLFLPRSLSTVLKFKLTTMAEPFQFDLPIPHSVKCTEDEALQKVASAEAISYKMIDNEMYEFVTVAAVTKIKEEKKHCIIPCNEGCMSVEDFIATLHSENIYPIVFHISAERERNTKFLLHPEQKDISTVPQDIKNAGQILDKSVPQYVTINLDRCSKLEDAVQQVMDKVAEETNKIIWVSAKSDVQI